MRVFRLSSFRKADLVFFPPFSLSLSFRLFIATSRPPRSRVRSAECFYVRVFSNDADSRGARLL